MTITLTAKQFMKAIHQISESALFGLMKQGITQTGTYSNIPFNIQANCGADAIFDRNFMVLTHDASWSHPIKSGYTKYDLLEEVSILNSTFSDFPAQITNLKDNAGSAPTCFEMPATHYVTTAPNSADYTFNAIVVDDGIVLPFPLNGTNLLRLFKNASNGRSYSASFKQAQNAVYLERLEARKRFYVPRRLQANTRLTSKGSVRSHHAHSF